MNVVVNFLSTLVSDESNGSIKRMLGLCGEFERIAKVVLDKAEKESHARKKRKTAPDDTFPQGANEQQTQTSPHAKHAKAPHNTPFSPSMFASHPSAGAGVSSPNDAKAFLGNEPTMPPGSGISNDFTSNINAMSGLGQDFQDVLSPEQLAGVGFPDQSFSSASPNMGSFQQPFVPQDLWQMPMTIEWDWADMSTNFPVFEGVGANGQPRE